MLCRVGYLMAQSGGVRPALDLNFLTGTLPSVVTFSRASAATDSFYTDAAGSSFNSYSSDAARLLATGLLIEESRTQRLLNSAAPVTQTTASLATGTYVFWCIGTGSVTSSAGTATASGLGAITGSQGTFQTIVVTVAGTLTFTVSGSINRFQLELGAFPTSFISSAGATATRAADLATVATSAFGFPANPTGVTIIGKGIVDTDLAIASHYLAEIDDGTINNALFFYLQPGSQMRSRTTTAGVNVTLTMAAPTANLAITFWAAYAPNDFAGQYNSNPKVVSAGPLAMPTGLSTLRLGSGLVDAVHQWNSTIAKLKIYKTRLPDAQAAAIAAAL